MSYLERLQAKAAMKADEAPAKGSKGAFAPFAGDPTAHSLELPVDCADGLKRLVEMPAPPLVRPNAWPVAVTDAVMLASDGWAAKALALGWSPLQLFGAVTDPAGDHHGDGLVVWLAGRKLMAISAATATVEDGTGWAYYHRHDLPGAQLMWDLRR